MKSNELRTGNFVKCFGIREVIAIKKDKIKVRHESKHGNFIIEWVPITSLSLEPIKLNEEWLLTNGFKKREEILNSNFVTFGIGENIITKDYAMLIKYFRDDNIFFYQNGFHTIKYIHQLQNLYFALTGEELILTNKTIKI